MSVEEIIQSWRRSPNIAPCITAFRIFAKREGEYRPFPDSLHPALREVLIGRESTVFTPIRLKRSKQFRKEET